MSISPTELEDMAEERSKVLKEFIALEPPKQNGEALIDLWEKLYNDDVKNTVVETVTGPSDDATNPAYPYEKLQAIVGDGGNWKWPRMWQRFDELERRGPAYRAGEKLNLNQPNKTPNAAKQRVLVVGGGPCGLRTAIELALGGHKVTQFEKRREKRDADGELTALGFSNRVNRPHMWNFVRNDLARLNGKDFMSQKAAYPVFTEPETSSIGIDELQLLLMKNALLLGVDFRLGVSYDDAKIVCDPKSQRPVWHVDCTYDEHSAEYFKTTKGKNVEPYDVIIGCDSSRSAVRDSQVKHFGNVEKRKFMDCVGIVSNLQKVSRKRLKELGFEHGQDPSDMNRGKTAFKPFFQKIEQEAEATLDMLIYYKASFHNYVIITPNRDTLQRHNVNGGIYTFGAARDPGGKKAGEKKKLMDFAARVLKVAGVPIDDTMSNGGFVDPPNDCMAFDFAECWNTKKSIVFNLPPPDYDTDVHGPWMGSRLVPMVALAGDSLLEPFWPMGLGLKRGWQAIMDTCYAVDNLYNRTCFCQKRGKDPDTFAWDDHYEALREQIGTNFEYCNRLNVGDELGRGEYDEKGVVMTQLRKLLKEFERPIFEVEIDPWTRYKPLEKEATEQWRNAMKAERITEENMHPYVRKYMAKRTFYQEIQKKGGAAGEIEYVGKKLVSINGKTIGGKQGGYVFSANKRPSIKSASGLNIVAEPAAVKPAAPKVEEVKIKALERKNSLAEKVLSQNLDAHMMQSTAKAPAASSSMAAQVAAQAALKKQMAGKVGGMCSSVSGMDGDVKNEMAYMPPSNAGDGLQDAADAMWARQMNDESMSPAQAAELNHIRCMMTSLTQSLEGYKKAEKELMLRAMRAPKM